MPVASLCEDLNNQETDRPSTSFSALITGVCALFYFAQHESSHQSREHNSRILIGSVNNADRSRNDERNDIVLELISKQGRFGVLSCYAGTQIACEASVSVGFAALKKSRFLYFWTRAKWGESENTYAVSRALLQNYGNRLFSAENSTETLASQDRTQNT